MLKEFVTRYVNKGVVVKQVEREVRKRLQTFDDCLIVEVLCYILQGLIGISEVPVTKIRGREIRW